MSFVTLRDIVHSYNVWELGAAVSFLKDIHCEAKHAEKLRDINVGEDWLKRLEGLFHYTKTQCQFLELRSAIERIDGPIRIALLQPMTYGVVREQVEALIFAIESDLRYRRFAFVPHHKASVLDGLENHWAVTFSSIPETREDVRDAVECFSLGMDTASVFHSMRVAELCLRRLAKKLKVRLTHKHKSQPIEYAEWDKVITACKIKIDAARTLPSGNKKEQMLELYSDASDHCLYMKDIWRNAISHTRKRYIESESRAVMDRVRAFSEFVAKKVTVGKSNP